MELSCHTQIRLAAFRKVFGAQGHFVIAAPGGRKILQFKMRLVIMILRLVNFCSAIEKHVGVRMFFRHNFPAFSHELVVHDDKVPLCVAFLLWVKAHRFHPAAAFITITGLDKKANVKKQSVYLLVAIADFPRQIINMGRIAAVV